MFHGFAMASSTVSRVFIRRHPSANIVPRPESSSDHRAPFEPIRRLLLAQNTNFPKFHQPDSQPLVKSPRYRTVRSATAGIKEPSRLHYANAPRICLTLL